MQMRDLIAHLSRRALTAHGRFGSGYQDTDFPLSRGTLQKYICHTTTPGIPTTEVVKNECPGNTYTVLLLKYYEPFTMFDGGS